MDQNFAALVAGGLGTERFGIVDIGCAGGIEPHWRVFGSRLRAIAVDASETDCARLRGLETNPDVEYVAAFIAGSTSKTFDLQAGQASRLLVDVNERQSFARTRDRRKASLVQATIEEKLRHNAWEMTDLADHAKLVVAPELIASRGWTDFDYLKIDIDGADFDVLRTFDGRFDALGVLGMQLEVNFVGTDAADEHIFHNTDRFMRSQGFDLFRLDVRTYSSRALPARYVWPTPSETLSGRPIQGEAYYARDLIKSDAAASSAEKLAKLMAIFSLWNLPDVAAELMLVRRDVLATIFDVDKGLDLLAAQTQPDRMRKRDYKTYLREFNADAPYFYRREGNLTLGERLSAAWRAYRRPRP